MSLDYWDRHVAPYLWSIEYRARWAASNARDAAAAVQMLPARPAFETRAEEMLETAETELSHALEIVRAARRKYDEAPIETSEAAA